MKGPRTIKSWITYGIAPLLLIILSVSVYQALRAQPDLSAAGSYIRNAFFSDSIGWLLAAGVGTVVNWGLEALKWKRLLQHTESVSWTKAYRGVLTGVSFTLFTPNRIGEYLGRIWHLSPTSRGAAVSLSIAGGMAQLFITALMGMVAYEFLSRGGFSLPLLPDRAWAVFSFRFAGWSVVIALLLIYFNLGEAGRFLSRVRWLTFLQESLQALVNLSRSVTGAVLGLSLLRFLVFLIQYHCLFQFFGVSLPIELSFLTVSFLFFALALIPSMALAELGVRGQFSLWIVGTFSANVLGIVLTATTIWFINLILPAILGGILMVKGRERV